MKLSLRCVPPSVSAQQKRANFVGGKPVFFHGQRMTREIQTWTSLLKPHAPPTPFDGALTVTLCLVWPHLKSTKAADRARYLPKTTRPDVDNVAKAIIDQLTKLRFIRDDANVTRLVLEKWHGPEEGVGIHLWIQRATATVPAVPPDPLLTAKRT